MINHRVGFDNHFKNLKLLDVSKKKINCFYFHDLTVIDQKHREIKS